MIRDLKVLIATVMALMAFGALSATAHAAEEKFHCSVEPCTATLAPDETAGTTTAHHVWVLKGKTASGTEATVSMTCNQLTGEATSATKTATELTFTKLKFENSAGEDKCKIGASEIVTIDLNSCDFKFTSTSGSTGSSEIHFLCSTAGDGLVITISGTERLRVTPFTANGIGYHDSGIGGAKKTVTATINLAIPNAALDLQNIGNSHCAALGMTSTIGATYTTGNTLIKAETVSGVPVEGWFE